MIVKDSDVEGQPIIKKDRKKEKKNMTEEETEREKKEK